MIISKHSLPNSFGKLAFAFIGLVCFSLTGCRSAKVDEAPLFIIMGQSNADGSAMFDPAIDSVMQRWYESDSNARKMKIWYRSSKVVNQQANALGEPARWIVDGDTTDARPGWMDLWYRNENDRGRTAMNMIHGYGTYSTGPGTDCAQGRRGIEGEFGRKFAEAYPDKELYVVKLGASGSFISSWADSLDNTNWNYFLEKMYRPAIEDLLKRGKRPKLIGVWWMQGCADQEKSREYYQAALERLVANCRSQLGFPDAKIYVGHIIKPGESTVCPSGSVQYGQGVRDAQDAVAAGDSRVETVDTKDFPLQYEANFNGYLHFSHAGQNAIADELIRRITAAGPDSWSTYVAPTR